VAPKTASVTASVRRKLDFSAEDLETNIFESSTTKVSPQKRGDPSSSKAIPKLMSSTTRPALKPSALSYEEERDETEQMEDDTALDKGGDSFQMINGGDGDEVEQIEEEQPEYETEPSPELPKKGGSRPKGKGKGSAVEHMQESEPEVESDAESEQEVEIESEPESVKRAAKRDKGKTRKEPPGHQNGEQPPAKRTRYSLEGAVSERQHVAKGKNAKSTKTSKAVPAPKPKATRKKPKLAAIAEAESPDIQRGPPLPRNNRGLFIMRRETPMEGTGFKQSRYGRNSIKPVAWWKNERIEYSEDEADDGKSKFLLSRIKEVIRKDEVEDTHPKRTYHPSSKKGKKRAPPEEEIEGDDIEPWETNPGRVYCEVRKWDPEDEIGAQTPEEEQEIAWSSAAIITKDVAGATFKFAKCVSMPFFGAGIMDLPVGSLKKPKLSRKMQMVFFVHTGRVQVTINGGDPFRISKGGMWQVPRGKCLCQHIFDRY
jgi:centromere protein C